MSFNGSPMINQAEVKLYDAAGHHLATLPLEQESSDVYSTVWDLLAKSGKRVSNGVYFYRITAAADAQRFRASGKIAVLR
jgi:flagellar hook assembly protein FlgD